jgi:hypothetical protein
MPGATLLRLASAVEALTGAALILRPALVVRLLLGGEISGVGFPLARIAGVGLLSLGLACWPRTLAARPALEAMCLYNTLTAAYLAYLPLRGVPGGALLWPAVALHVVLAVLLTAAWRASRSARASAST